MVKPVKSMGMNPLPYFIGCKISFLIRTNTHNWVFYISKDCDFGRSLIGKESKFIYGVKCLF